MGTKHLVFAFDRSGGHQLIVCPLLRERTLMQVFLGFTEHLPDAMTIWCNLFKAHRADNRWTKVEDYYELEPFYDYDETDPSHNIGGSFLGVKETFDPNDRDQLFTEFQKLDKGTQSSCLVFAILQIADSEDCFLYLKQEYSEVLLRAFVEAGCRVERKKDNRFGGGFKEFRLSNYLKYWNDPYSGF